MDIFIIRDGRQAGPYGEDAVRAFLTEGTARPTDMGWRTGMTEWRPLGEVLKAQCGPAGSAARPEEPAALVSTPNGSAAADAPVPATAKQKLFLKYIGAEFGETLTKEHAAIAISDALENPKLQPRVRKWHDDKLRQHPDVFQDEIDFRRANRASRYLDRIQTEGADVLKDVTKAHVQVLVESLDKRHPAWESDREAALWNHQLPAVGEHLPQLVLPSYKDRLKVGGGSQMARVAARGVAAASAEVMPPPSATGTLGAMMRGVVLGVIALGAIIAGQHFWQQSHGPSASVVQTVVSDKKEPSAAPNAVNEPAPKDPAAPPDGKLAAEANEVPDAAAQNAVPPVPAAPQAPAPAMNAEKPDAAEEKPAPPASAAPDATPAAAAAPAASPPGAAATPPPPATPPLPRSAVKLTQGIGIMLPNGQVTLPVGTVLRYIATEGPNIRVSWNNNVFFVPAMATDVNEPLPVPNAPITPVVPPGTPAANASVPTDPAAAAKPRKPADDL